MKKLTHIGVSTVLAIVFCLGSAAPARAISLISNGGFEVGFTSWTIADQLGSDGTFFLQSGTTSPVNGDLVPAPPGGTTAAMTDAQGPGSHVLFQDFVAAAALLSFDLFIGNRAPDFFTPTPASLDFATPELNQQARVDILLASADPFSVAAVDVLMNLYQTQVGDPLVSGYNNFTFDLTSLLNAHAGKTLRLRFAETDNVFTFQLGVDNVSLDTAPIPEPASLLLVGTGLVALRKFRRRS